MGKRTFLHYKKRRYHCPCCKKHFYETFRLLPKYCRITTRLSFYAIHLLKNRYSVYSSAKLLGLSSSSVFRRFHAILTDAHNHQLFDILPTRGQTSVMQYLLSFPNRKEVEYLISDMNQVYRDLALQVFPNATIVIDKFHVVRYITWALENVRKRIQKQMHPSKRKYFKRNRRLLLTHKSKLNQE